MTVYSVTDRMVNQWKLFKLSGCDPGAVKLILGVS